MTAATQAHPTWTLPHRIYPRQPHLAANQIPWVFEELIWLYVQSDEETLLSVLHTMRPELTWSEFWERVERVCVMSAQVGWHEQRGELGTGACHVAEREYADALADLVPKVGA